MLLHSEGNHKQKRQLSECEKIFAKEATDKRLISKKKEQLLQLNIKTTQKMGRISKQTFSKEDIQIAKKYMKRCSRSLIIKECKSKLQWGIILHLSEWPSSKNVQTINTGEDVEKKKSFYTVDGNVNWNSYYGE